MISQQIKCKIKNLDQYVNKQATSLGKWTVYIRPSRRWNPTTKILKNSCCTFGQNSNTWQLEWVSFQLKSPVKTPEKRNTYSIIFLNINKWWIVKRKTPFNDLYQIISAPAMR